MVKVVLLAAVVAVATVSPGIAAEQAGSAVAVLQSANVQGGSGSRVLEVKGGVFMGDRVETGKTGQAQLLFLDNTRMVVGPNSRLTVDKFVYQGGATAKQFSVTAVRGAFRFITGASQKQAYVIKTPTATIGVRGTRFDFTVGADGTTNFALYEGGVKLCDRVTRRCANIEGACSVVVLPPNKDFRWVKDINQRTSMFRRTFPYAFRQANLRHDFRVRSSSCNVTYGIDVPQRSLPTDHAVAPSAPAAPAATPPATPPPTQTPGNSPIR